MWRNQHGRRRAIASTAPTALFLLESRLSTMAVRDPIQMGKFLVDVGMKEGGSVQKEDYIYEEARGRYCPVAASCKKVQLSWEFVPDIPSLVLVPTSLSSCAQLLQVIAQWNSTMIRNQGEFQAALVPIH